MKKKALALAVAGALVSPAAFAAQDTSGMQYTSASEGFYATIRSRYQSNTGTAGTDAHIRNSGSKIGVRGTNDLGGGLSGFYHLEWAVATDNGNKTDPFQTRHGHVGLRGAFGEIRMGSGWNHIYNNVTSGTDIASVSSGNFYGDLGMNARDKGTIQYDSPDLNGFKVGFDAQMATTGDNSDGDDIDRWGVSGHYSVAGFSVGAAYNVDVNGISGGAIDTVGWTDAATNDTNPFMDGNQIHGGSDALVWGDVTTDDYNSYALKAGYAQDNWYVNTWYGEDNNEDRNLHGGEENNVVFSIGGGVEIDKINVYFVHENKEYSTIGVDLGELDSDGNDSAVTDNKVVVNSGDDAYSTFGVVYRLGAQTRVWVEYAAADLDSSQTKDDYVTIGLRHDF